MYVIRKDSGEEIFRGPAEHAKAFYGNTLGLTFEALRPPREP